MTPPDWPGRLAFLLGKWVDEERLGEPGTDAASGETWRSELDGRLLVRNGWCEFPATATRPAFRHEDLLIVFADDEGQAHGIFWDNEGHTISYRDIRVAPEGKGVRLSSDPSTLGPRQQLEYRFEGPGRLTAVFSLQLPGETKFSPYLRWRSARTDPSAR